MKTLGEVLTLSATFLHSHQVERAKREAEDLLALSLSMKRLDLYLSFERVLSEEELAKIRLLLKKRAEGVPFGFLAKQIAFFSILLEITPAVLIPRPETELLVEKIALELSKENSLEGKRLWDLCTGSGCIALALKKRFPLLTVIASDLSSAALEVAKKNASLNHLDLTFFEGDLFIPFQGMMCNYFVCNPPYLSEKEYLESSRELKQEPKSALVAEEEGLAFYKRIATDLSKYLVQGGKAFLEIGYQQEEEVKKLFISSGYPNVRVENDLAGHPRFFFLE